MPEQQQIAPEQGTGDAELLARAQKGDLPAFETLVELHRDKVYGLALRMTRSDADASEITQETFLSAYQHMGEFRGEAAFGSWVHRIAAILVQTDRRLVVHDRAVLVAQLILAMEHAVSGAHRAVTTRAAAPPPSAQAPS